jgi:hypothetical protein
MTNFTTNQKNRKQLREISKNVCQNWYISSRNLKYLRKEDWDDKI